MRKLIVVVAIIFYCLNVFGQSPRLKELWKLSKKKEWHDLVEKGNSFLETDSANVEYHMMVGYALFQLNKINESKPYFEKAALHNDPHSSIRARSLLYLGLCYFLEMDYEKSKKALEDSKKIKSYSSIKEYNDFWYERLGYDDFFLTWQEVESEHFLFKFQDTTDLNYKRFIRTCEESYTTIDTFFNSNIERRIDYFVWTSTTDARNIIKTAGAFANPTLFLIHGNTNENEGHEIAHVISLNYKKD